MKLVRIIKSESYYGYKVGKLKIVNGEDEDNYYWKKNTDCWIYKENCKVLYEGSLDNCRALKKLLKGTDADKEKYIISTFRGGYPLKEKSLQDYIDKYKGCYTHKSRDGLFGYELERHYKVSELSFEDCCGIMAMICDDLGRGGNCIIEYNNHTKAFKPKTHPIFFESPWRFKSEKLVERAIKICGDEFFKKLFRL